MGEGAVRMEVIIFGKVKCGKCKGAQKRVNVLIEKMGLNSSVPVRFVDLESVDGRAEGAFHDVYDAVPVTIIQSAGENLHRWEGVMPKTDEMKPFFERVNGATAD